MYNLIVLNHFYGYPDLMDKGTNDIRYAKLLCIIDTFNSDNTIFLCSSDDTQYAIDNNTPEFDDKRLESIRTIAGSEGHRWIHYNDKETIKDILNKINPMLTEGTSTDINVIIGGTNTSGCLLNNSNVAAINWINLGFNVQICLSICADYQMDGINSADKNHKAMAKLYNFIKDNNIIDKVGIEYDIIDLRRNE
tara:strand:+ start:1482 stop:2063 length:582 start_codon:yes stop_codon:yes gene_type:complete